MRLRHIEVIQALLQTGNLGHAAELLQLLAATLSATLQEAEQQLGFMLFSSVRGRLQATRDTLVLQPLINQLYQARGMLPIDATLLTPRGSGGPVYWLAEDEDSGAVIGSVMGLNHHTAFHDPENGSSLWCLAVDPHCTRPGVGEVLVRHLVEHFMSRGLSYLDLSVLHDNRQAKSLYAKLGFRALATFAIKRKNGINQPLFLGPGPQAGFNPYARIIVEEAHRRGIDVQTAQDIRRSGDANRPTGQFKVVVTTVNLDTETAFQLFNVVIKRAAQAQQTGVVRGLKGDFASVCIQAVPLIHR